MNENKTNINWYPGHMAKTKRLISDNYNLIDVVYELVDARIPYSSKIKDIDTLVKNKPRILVMTKTDLCDLKVTNNWKSYYEKKGYHVLMLDLTNNKDYLKLVKLTNEIMSGLREKIESRGLTKKEIRALVVGVPNVGKSTLINQFANKKVANVGNTPGVTKQINWLKTPHNILLLDTPGILWPKIDNEIVGLNLASFSAIKNEIIPEDKVAVYILNTLNRHYPDILKTRFKVDNISLDIEETYEKIGRSLNFITRGNEVDYDKISNYILNDLKNNIKGITFDRDDFNE